ncbi:hypothetical protein LCGC14_2630780 [marine sediment metagenome]|uniref:NusG-like N-terminal domain-containing protein n=1 Tax=marine sediment metagenome TaxID=412755 RepID=A0A0F9CSS0_9ZZZZ
MLYPEVDSLGNLSGQWWVAHTKARFEKAFAWELLHHDVSYFLPMIQRVRISSGRSRKRRVLLPLFPSYVFIRGSEEDRLTAIKTNRLCRIIEVPDQDKLTDELVAIEMVLANGVDMDLHPHAAVGQRCRIRSGPMHGLEGVVVRRNRKARIVLEVAILGQGASMEIDADLLEAIE